jgi:hypothetical protein
MIVSKVKATNLCKPPGMGKDDSSSRRVAEDVSEQMENSPNGIQQIETGPGDTLESVAKGHLKGSGQKMDLGNILFNQQKIVSDNYDQIQAGMKDKGKNPEDFKTFRGRELPQGIKLNLETSHTQNSITPTNPMERDHSHATSGTKDAQNADPVDQQNSAENDDKYSAAGSISNTQYALELQGISLSKETQQGMQKYLQAWTIS